ncbi:26S proteasome non-ATPase regulatory subunit 9 [Eurytemora carolleeae]|uniref:26S proteasome non-ATPase regulatory subunit 9 n=1 Tax=Eurytemora carolleeae TaxID=1294199 RepID=UPI000C784497|nr:26S proteasome non-ATPase regulatory subunit 9 [Eurytemora carolleeae]|eukprot:XP_023332707.1 26S proteasome non-ATPase regulatory subunit 9-like [Eurytemora affinis]
MSNFTRAEVLEFIKIKESIEEELKVLYDVLKTQGVGMEDPLVDAEGFPRADIDVYQVRHARHSIRTKSNDLKDVLNKIESGLHNIHAQAREGIGLEDNLSSLSTGREKPIPFARVLVVCAGSPAETAGIKPGDLIAGFGSVNSSNFTSLKSISEVVEHSENKPLTVILLRDDAVHRLRLTPEIWSGQGLLGLKIRPLSISPAR